MDVNDSNAAPILTNLISQCGEKNEITALTKHVGFVASGGPCMQS